MLDQRLPVISGDAALVKFIDGASRPLTADDLHELLVGNTIEAIYVQRVCDAEECRQLADIVSAQKRRHDRIGGLSIVGNTHYHNGETADPAMNGAQFDDWLRDATADPSPLDKCLRLFADLGQAGTVLEMLRGHGRLPKAILRHYCGDEASEILPHQDVIEWDVDFATQPAPIGQAGWNLYCDVCETGGDLCLFGVGLDEGDYASAIGDDYGLAWAAAGDPVVRIRPCVGDLIIINTHRLHAIRKVDSRRVTLSGFIGSYADGSYECWA